MVRSALTAAILGLAISSSAIAQSDFPSKPIRVIVPFAAGSGADGSARVLAEQMQSSPSSQLFIIALINDLAYSRNENRYIRI